MISIWDDLPLHQTPATLDQPATSDPATYERYYFGFCSIDGEAAVGLVVNLHPNKGLIDAGFSVSRGGRHESLFASDHLGVDRADLICGPIRLQLLEPMRQLRISVDGPEFDASITFAALTPAIQEDRVTRLRSNRIVQDRSRYAQMGEVRGTVTSPLGKLELTCDGWRGHRDHSWGIWDAPKEHAQDTKETSTSFFWLIGSFDDYAVQAVTHQDAAGVPYGAYAAVVPTLARGAELAGPGALQQARPVESVQPEFPARSWHFTTALVSIGTAEAKTERIHLESMHEMLPRAVTYGHPSWVSGHVYPELPHVVRDSWSLRDEDLTARINHRALQFVRMSREDGAIGYGVVDQCLSAVRKHHTSRA
ncbi:hypothetical protein N864_00265 [Intrasporangium chromatireducens Q5-1]|uniref:Uncharacterized protein n=1 Tax=Intrasporangium chromatireducens Q5-1 TaxID=584657 RepID=W9GIM4_9MICO|nr:hypothetical protein [Intrasporangium chromatireducens]EWT06076.1 hypothetical protein N864_00265 [Intrasporangium chromatireducens Q5-1]